MENLKYTELLQLNKKLSGIITGRPYRIGILANVTLNSMKEILEYSCRLNNMKPDIEIGNFDNIVQDSLSQEKDLVIIFYDMLNIADTVSGLFEDIPDEKYNELKQKICLDLDIIFQNLKSVPSVIFNTFSSAGFVSQYSQPSKIDSLTFELNQYLEVNKPENVTLINIDKIFLIGGIRDSIDFRFYHSSKAPYTVSFFKKFVQVIEPVILRNTGKLKKAIIFDCDNTLWKGVLGEDGKEGIDMSSSSIHGKFFNKVQQLVVYLSKLGIIIGLCSKNNEQDVDEILSEHPDMILKDEHLVIKKVNWQDKVTNLKAIAEELNIGIESIVFVDDSSFEVNLIKEKLPQVMVLQVPENSMEYPDLLLKTIYRYFNLNIGTDDARRTEMYKQQFQREAAMNTTTSLEDYLASLKISLTIMNNDTTVIPRVAQLTQKTNQFNLTTRRYTEAQVKHMMQDNEFYIFSMSVKDKFGDSGLTGICMVKYDCKSKTAFIDNLLMSCRIIGRNIEIAFINNVLEVLNEFGCQFVKAEYIPTNKNAQVESFYEKAGFQLTDANNGTRQYNLELSGYEKRRIYYIEINNN